MYKYLLIILIFFVSNLNSSAQKNFVLIKNATSNYVIVVPVNANAIEKQSAAVLQDYIFRITNCRLSVVSAKPSLLKFQIIVGRNTFISTKETRALGGDGFIIRRINNALILTGGNRKGVLYSVYTLLEEYLGCRMYTSQAVYLPHNSTISLPVNISLKEKPSFTYRMTYFIDGFSKNYCDFHKMNYFLEDWGLWVHSFQTLVPKEKYFQSHPEYFSLVNGKRSADQLCLSNPNVLLLVTQTLEKLIKENPNQKYWSVSQNDNDNNCQCENCKRLNNEQGSYQGSLLPFVNNVAKHFPDKTITTLAYRNSEAAPKNLKPLPNVLIMLCTAFDERRIPYKEQTSFSFYSNFKKWSTICPELFIWDYIVPFVHALTPFPNFYTIQPNVQFFASKHVTRLFLEGIGEMPGEFSELRCYLVSRIMWNKNINVKFTMQEFINGYYGLDGGKYITDYINLLDKNASLKPTPLGGGGSPVAAENTYLSHDNTEAYKNIFENALQATAGTIYNARVMKEYLPVLYSELEIIRLGIASGKTKLVNKQTNITLLNNFYAKMKQLNIIYLNEARMNVNDYYRQYNQLLMNSKQE